MGSALLRADLTIGREGVECLKFLLTPAWLEVDLLAGPGEPLRGRLRSGEEVMSESGEPVLV